MLKVSVIKNNIEGIKKALLKRGFSDFTLLEKIIKEDKLRKKNQQKLEKFQHKGNIIAKEVGELFKTGDKDEANKKKKEALFLRENIKLLQNRIKELDLSLNKTLITIPNIPHKLVPEGSSEEDNIVVKENFTIPQLHKKAKPHWELAKQYELIDFELGNKITGSGFPVYTNKGAKLQRALINFFLDKNINAGYVEYLPPILVNQDSAFGTGQFPDKEGQMYHVKADDLYLIPTAEVPITNLFRDVILDKKDIPVKCTAYTPCFRREAGSYGKNVRGLNRLHQFDKVEIVQIQTPEKSYDTLEKMVLHVESILIDLELPYRIVRLCGGDLGLTSSLTYDFEVYSAIQKKWLEVSSVSNFENYQTNRLKLRFREDKKTRLCHTLNGSALALPRILAAILENNQQEEGIQMPKKLHSYTGFQFIN